MSEAYWRAWLSQTTDAARDDIERAKAMSTTNMILRLAGIIEHGKDDSTLRKDLNRAKNAIGGESCVARCPGAGGEAPEWTDSAGHFEDATADNAALLSEALERCREHKDRPGVQGAADRRVQAAIKEDRSRTTHRRSCRHFARGGDVPGPAAPGDCGEGPGAREGRRGCGRSSAAVMPEWLLTHI